MSNPIIAVHLDFKGVAFRPAYFPQLLCDLANQGVNTVLVEYEDVFPFYGIDICADKSVAWSPDTLREFLAEAQQHGIEVIPLQQCLGHLEYLLSWPRYRSFALDFDSPGTLDLNNPQARTLIFDMLHQMIAAHPSSQYIHLGMDEARSLVSYAHAQGEDVLELFTAYLNQLCDLCEEAGKTPIIWSDMLEDHIGPSSLLLLEKLKNRVVLCVWNYSSSTRSTPFARVGGQRVSKAWLAEPENSLAPTIAPDQKYIEDLDMEVQEVLAPHRCGKFFKPMFQAELWSSLGFRVLGASACRASIDGPILPFYNVRCQNIRAWSRAIMRTEQVGHVATAWARGNTWYPPNFPFDLCWPMISELAGSMGARRGSFFRGIRKRTLDRLFQTLGRCREDWRVEESVACEMEELLPQLRAHHYEWQSIILMTKLLALVRKVEAAVLDVDTFHANERLIDSQWQRRLNDEEQLLEELTHLRREVHAHFAQRYHGQAFEEWVRHCFNLHINRLEKCQRTCRARLRLSADMYSIDRASA